MEIEARKRAYEHENALEVQQDRYDAVTAHGGDQPHGPPLGFPGGLSTRFECPPRNLGLAPEHGIPAAKAAGP